MQSQRKMTPKGEMSGSGSGPPIAHLPPHLKAMFHPGPPIEYKPPIIKRKMPPLTGIASFVDKFEITEPPQRVTQETPNERREQRLKQKKLKQEEILKHAAAAYDPNNVTDATEDAYKTLFVARISYDTVEKKLRREFEHYGNVKDIKLVHDREGKPRGYAFIEFESEADMKEAYRSADGMKIDGRRVVVDVERGRTVSNWKPRRLGGGLGSTRKGGPDVNSRYSEREANRENSFRGGGRARRDDGRGDRNRDRRDRNRDGDRNRDRSDRSRDGVRNRDHDRRRRSRSRSYDRDRRDRGRRDNRDRERFRD